MRAKFKTYVPITNADFSNLSVAPNPIKNEALVFDVSVSRTMTFDVEVYSLDGDLISTEEIRLRKADNMHREISLPKDRYPYSQVRVKLIFADGSINEEIVSLTE